MKKSTTKKLVLSKTTVSRLGRIELTGIRGGIIATSKCRYNEDTDHC